MHAVRLTSIVYYEVMAGDNFCWQAVCLKGESIIGGGETPVYEYTYNYIAGGRNLWK